MPAFESCPAQRRTFCVVSLPWLVFRHILNAHILVNSVFSWKVTFGCFSVQEESISRGKCDFFLNLAPSLI